MENTMPQTSRATRSLNLKASFCDEQFQDYAVAFAAAGNALPVETDAATNVVQTLKTTLYATNIGTQTLLAPKVVSTGLSLAGDQTNGDGFELTLQNPGNTDAKFLFTVGSEPVGFFLEAKMTVADVSWAIELLAGFRKNGAVTPARATYSDYAFIGLTGADIKIATDLDDAGEVLTDTTENLADTGEITVRIEVQTDGKVTYLLANSTTDTLNAPTVFKDFQFNTGDVIVPAIRMLNGSDLADAVVLNSLKCGYLW